MFAKIFFFRMAPTVYQGQTTQNNLQKIWKVSFFGITNQLGKHHSTLKVSTMAKSSSPPAKKAARATKSPSPSQRNRAKAQEVTPTPRNKSRASAKQSSDETKEQGEFRMSRSSLLMWLRKT